MSEAKDPTLKLFGENIPFQELLYRAPAPDDYNPCPDSVLEKDTLGGKPTEAKLEAEAQPLSVKDTMSEVSENPKTPSVEETVSVKMSEEELSETSVSQDKTLKKPDKIIPCPRCNSMDTKFCYYNNYNVNQARHLCRSCQRYWTAGGTMRNVPVGAGRRKSKNSASHCHHIAISEAQPDIPNGLHHPSLQTNGTVLTFGSCESMAEETLPKGFHRHEDAKILVSDIALENGDDRLHGSSKDDTDTNESIMNSQGCYPQTSCFPGAPWPYQWSSPVHPPFFFPMPFYPTVPCWFLQPPFPVQTAQATSPNSPTLGKHPREENESMLKSSNSDKDEQCEENIPKRCLLIPKTLRIGDPGEAAKSSIWATLGIKYDEADSVSREGLFRAFRSKLNGKSHMVGTSPALHANPAALSRSLNFQESS